MNTFEPLTPPIPPPHLIRDTPWTQDDYEAALFTKYPLLLTIEDREKRLDARAAINSIERYHHELGHRGWEAERSNRGSMLRGEVVLERNNLWYTLGLDAEGIVKVELEAITI